MMNIFYVYGSYFQFKIDDCSFKKKNVFILLGVIPHDATLEVYFY